jgi:hypothetical protein
MILHKAKLIDQNFPNNQMIYQCMMQHSSVDYALKTLEDNPIKELLTPWKESKRSHWIHKIFKSNRVANFLSKLDPYFFCHPCSNYLSGNTANIYKILISELQPDWANLKILISELQPDWASLTILIVML